MADQLWFMTCIREEEATNIYKTHKVSNDIESEALKLVPPSVVRQQQVDINVN